MRTEMIGIASQVVQRSTNALRHSLKKVSCVFILCLLGMLSSCSSNQQRAAEMWSQSVNYFDNGEFDRANLVAAELSKLGSDGSTFLLDQYRIYAAIVGHNDLSKGMDSVYSDLINVPNGGNPGFVAFNLISKTFSVRFLEGKPSAEIFFTDECKALMHMKPSDCANVVFQQVGGQYFKDHSRFGALLFYEFLRLSDDLELKVMSDSYTRFYTAMALQKIDDAQANILLKDLQSKGLFVASMANQYCVYMKLETHEPECNEIIATH